MVVCFELFDSQIVLRDPYTVHFFECHVRGGGGWAFEVGVLGNKPC